MNLIAPVSRAKVAFGAMTTLKSISASLGERTTMLTALGGVTVLLLGWAVFIRKPRRRRSSYRYPSNQTQVRSASTNGAADGPPRRRRRRRQHRPRNPTRAETGGLPPVRPEEPQESAG